MIEKRKRHQVSKYLMATVAPLACWIIFGIARRSVDMHAIGQQLSSRSHHDNGRSGRSGWNFYHADCSAIIASGIAGILPGGRIYGADQRLVHRIRSVDSRVRMELEVRSSGLWRLLWFNQLQQHGRAASPGLRGGSDRRWA